MRHEKPAVLVVEEVAPIKPSFPERSILDIPSLDIWYMHPEKSIEYVLGLENEELKKARNFYTHHIFEKGERIRLRPKRKGLLGGILDYCRREVWETPVAERKEDDLTYVVV